MHTIQQLIREHEQLDDMAGDLMDITAAEQPAAIDAFTALRALALALDNHLLVERDFLLPAPGKDLAIRLKEELRAFEREFRDLDSEWSTYIHEWTVDNIAEDWRNFDHATRWVMGRLRARIRRENDILYPMALQYGQIRLREQASVAAELGLASGAYI